MPPFALPWIVLALTAAPQRIAVMDIRLQGGIPANIGAALSEAIVTEVRKRVPQASVISAEEIRSMIQVEGQKQQLGCHGARDTACLAEIGGALGAERLLIGGLNKIGKTYVFSLKLIDSARAKVVHSASVSLRTKEDDELLAATQRLVGQIFSDLPELPAPLAAAQPSAAPSSALAPEGVQPPAPAPPLATSVALRSDGHSRLPAVLLGAAGLAAGGVAVFGLVQVLNYNADVSVINAGNPGHFTHAQYASDQQAAQLWSPLAIGLAVAAAAGLTGAVLTW